MLNRLRPLLFITAIDGSVGLCVLALDVVVLPVYYNY